MALFLLIIIAAIALGIVGFVAKGLLYLLIIGVVLFLADFIFLGARLRGRGRGRHPAR
jgi:energy-coupling factor transporter transmembrane protein EcfT